MATVYSRSNNNSRKWYAKLEQCRKIDEAVRLLRNEGKDLFTIQSIANKSGLSYRTVGRYVDKERLKLLRKGYTNLSELVFGSLFPDGYLLEQTGTEII
jgi:hypothetical protein